MSKKHTGYSVSPGAYDQYGFMPKTRSAAPRGVSFGCILMAILGLALFVAFIIIWL